MNKTFAYMIVLLSACGFFCSCCTKPQETTITGMVILDNDTANPDNDSGDFSGVTIALYALATPDTTLARLNSEYPNIGVQICQETEFDHRDALPVKSVLSNADGSFELAEIDPGTYNLAIFKEGWGVRYMYNLVVGAGETENVGSIKLFPALVYSSSVLEDFTFKTDHTYLIDEDISFIGNVTLEPRATVLVEPGRMIRFHAGVSTPQISNIDQAWKLISARDIYSTAQAPINSEDYLASIAFYGQNLDLSGGIMKHINGGMMFASSSVSISDLLLQDFGSGISVPQGTATFTNLTIANGLDNETNTGININSGTPELIQISKCVFTTMHQGIVINSIGTFNIEDCYFHETFRAIAVATCPGSIIHSCFEKNQFDIQRSSGSGLTSVSYNVFFDTVRTTIRPIGLVTVNFNNFYRTGGYFIDIYSPDLPNNSTVPGDMDAKNNYWAASELDLYLYDALDNSDHSAEPCAFNVLYIPKRSNPVPEAGAR